MRSQLFQARDGSSTLLARSSAADGGLGDGDADADSGCCPHFAHTRDAPLSRTLVLATLLALAFLAYPAVGEAHMLTRADVRAVVVEDVRQARESGRRVTAGMIQRHWQRMVRRARRHNERHLRNRIPIASGVTSCYGDGDGFMGQTMANGRTLTPSTIGVAHKTLPFGTRRRFQVAGRSVVVTVTDRGPFTPGRSWDLTVGAVRALGFSGCAAWGVRGV